jgi:hypothetical protein
LHQIMQVHGLQEVCHPYNNRLQHCMFEVNTEADNFKKERRQRFFGHILKLCKEWTEVFTYDFVSDLMMTRLKVGLSRISETSQVFGLFRNYSVCARPITRRRQIVIFYWRM